MFLLVAALILVIVYGVGRLTGKYKPKSYKAVTHKEHIRYIPKKGPINAPLDHFPTRPPKEGEHITPEGELVSD